MPAKSLPNVGVKGHTVYMVREGNLFTFTGWLGRKREWVTWRVKGDKCTGQSGDGIGVSSAMYFDDPDRKGDHICLKRRYTTKHYGRNSGCTFSFPGTEIPDMPVRCYVGDLIERADEKKGER